MANRNNDNFDLDSAEKITEHPAVQAVANNFLDYEAQQVLSSTPPKSLIEVLIHTLTFETVKASCPKPWTPILPTINGSN